ncbi:MAG: hypothetical protein V3U26_07205, partial [Dehalococcoidia bacterium]
MALAVAGLLLAQGLGRAAAEDGNDVKSTVPIPPPEPPTPAPAGPDNLEAGDEPGRLIASGLSVLNIGPGTLVRAMDQTTILLTGSEIRLEADADGAQIIVFPLDLAPGQELGEFRDLESGIVWESTSPEGHGTLTIPLARDGVSAVLVVQLGPNQSVDGGVQARVLGAVLDIGPVDVEVAGSEPGTVAMAISLDRVPSEIVVELRGVILGAGLVSAISQAAEGMAMGVAATAYAVGVEVDVEGLMASAGIEMGVAKRWADVWARDRIHIARIDDEGRA